jgi:hypothetical protein
MERISDVDIKRWTKRGNNCVALSRNHDLPSIVYFVGERYWCKHGKWNREKDLPTIICYNGGKFWFKEDKEYRRDKGLPTIIYSSGGKCY